MKVLYFHQHFTSPRGSWGVRSYQMAKRLIEAGHDVTMVCAYSERSANEIDRPFVNGCRRGNVDGIDLIELDLPYSNSDPYLKRVATFLKFSARSVWIALREDYDIAFATSTPLTAGIPGIAAKIFRRKRFVFEIRDLWPELPREMGVITNPVVLWAMGVLEWCSYRAADRCVGLSPGIVEGIQRRSRKGLPVVMIPNACDLDIFNTGDRGTCDLSGVDKGDFCAVFTGTHGIANGLHRVLDVAAVLEKRQRTNIKLVLIGDGKLKPLLVERAQREGLNSMVFVDPMPKMKLAELLGRFSVGLQILDNVPAFYYGTSPNKFFDYLAAGLPVLTNYPGWVADLIQQNDCGVPVPPEDAEAFADALVQMADDPEGCQRMAANSRRLAEAEFSRDQLGEKWVEFVVGENEV